MAPRGLVLLGLFGLVSSAAYADGPWCKYMITRDTPLLPQFLNVTCYNSDNDLSPTISTDICPNQIDAYVPPGYSLNNPPPPAQQFPGIPDNLQQFKSNPMDSSQCPEIKAARAAAKNMTGTPDACSWSLKSEDDYQIFSNQNGELFTVTQSCQDKYKLPSTYCGGIVSCQGLKKMVVCEASSGSGASATCPSATECANKGARSDNPAHTTRSTSDGASKGFTSEVAGIKFGSGSTTLYIGQMIYKGKSRAAGCAEDHVPDASECGEDSCVNGVSKEPKMKAYPSIDSDSGNSNSSDSAK